MERKNIAGEPSEYGNDDVVSVVFLFYFLFKEMFHLFLVCGL